jgi:hypothetical protein
MMKIGDWDNLSRLSFYPLSPPKQTLQILLDHQFQLWRESPPLENWSCPESLKRTIRADLIGVQSRSKIQEEITNLSQLKSQLEEKTKAQKAQISSHCKNLASLLLTLLQKLLTPLGDADFKYDPITRETLNQARTNLHKHHFQDLKSILQNLRDPKTEQQAAHDFQLRITQDQNTKLLFYQVMSDTSLDQLTSVNLEISQLEETSKLIAKSTIQISESEKRIHSIDLACWARDKAIKTLPDVLGSFETLSMMRLKA